MVEYLDAGRAESVKLGVHACVGGLAVICLAYNALAWVKRRERHLAVNVVVYSALTAFEIAHVAHHRDHRCDR